jgi:hypothetical protein
MTLQHTSLKFIAYGHKLVDQTCLSAIAIILILLFYSTLSTANLNNKDHAVPKTAAKCQGHCKVSVLSPIE